MWADRLGCGVIGSLACGALRLAGLGVPGEQGGDDKDAFGHLVRDLELQVHGSDLRGREDVRAVVAITRRALPCASTPAGDRVGGQAPLCGVVADEPGGGV